MFVFSTDLSGISSNGEPFVEVIVPAGTLSAEVTLDAVDDDVADGNQTVELVAGAFNFLNARTSVIVLDDGTDPVPLEVCDIAFVGYAADAPDGFAFVALTDIPAETEIFFTDNGWISDIAGFREGEGIVAWTAPAGGIPALTVVSIFNNDPYDAVSSNGPAGGSVVEIINGGPSLSSGGDQIFAYQGSLAAPIFLAALQADGPFVQVGEVIDPNTSTLPGALATGGALVFDPEFDNVAYDGPIAAADLASVKALVFDTANFATDNSRNNVTFPTSSFILGELSDYSVTIADCSVAAGQFVINFTATGASDVYVSSDLVSFTLSTNGGGVASGTYTDTAPPAGRAFYLIQEAGTPAP